VYYFGSTLATAPLPQYRNLWLCPQQTKSLTINAKSAHFHAFMLKAKINVFICSVKNQGSEVVWLPTPHPRWCLTLQTSVIFTIQYLMFIAIAIKLRCHHWLGSGQSCIYVVCKTGSYALPKFFFQKINIEIAHFHVLWVVTVSQNVLHAQNIFFTK